MTSGDTPKSRGGNEVEGPPPELSILLPHPRCYWVAPTLLVGAHPRCRHHLGVGDVVDDLVSFGVDVFVDLTVFGECDEYAPDLRAIETESPVGVARVEVPDFGAPTVDQVREVLDRLEEAETLGRVTYLHDHFCDGRSSTVLGCLLVNRLSGEEALERVSALRAAASLTDSPAFDLASQTEFVLDWADVVDHREARRLWSGR